MLIAYGAVSGRLRSTPVSQAMVFVALGLAAGNWFLDLVEADTANQFVRHLAEAIARNRPWLLPRLVRRLNGWSA